MARPPISSVLVLFPESKIRQLQFSKAFGVREVIRDLGLYSCSAADVTPIECLLRAMNYIPHEERSFAAG